MYEGTLIESLTDTVKRAESAQFRREESLDERLEPLREAYSILNQASGRCASGPMSIYRTVGHAREHIGRQMQEMCDEALTTL